MCAEGSGGGGKRGQAGEWVLAASSPRGDRACSAQAACGVAAGPAHTHGEGPLTLFLDGSSVAFGRALHNQLAGEGHELLNTKKQHTLPPPVTYPNTRESDLGLSARRPCSLVSFLPPHLRQMITSVNAQVQRVSNRLSHSNHLCSLPSSPQQPSSRLVGCCPFHSLVRADLGRGS